MDRQNINEKCKKCDGVYKSKFEHLWKDKKGWVYCDKCGDVEEPYEYSKMHDSIITKTDQKTENGINYFVVYYETKEVGYNVADYINIEKSIYFENRRDVKLHNLENLRDVCLKHKYVKVHHKTIITQFGTDGFGMHGPDNPLINEWIYYFKDCRLHNEFGPSLLMYEKWCDDNPNACITPHENGINSLFGMYYIDGVKIGFRGNKKCVGNDDEFFKCMKIRNLCKPNINSSGIYEPPPINIKSAYCNERHRNPEGDHWIYEMEHHKSDYTEETINDKEKIYIGKGTKIHTVNGLIESINDEPAVEFCCGQVKYWFKENKLHREYGPAIVTNEIEKYYINHIEVSTDEEFTNFKRRKILGEVLYKLQDNSDI